ncbi:MAG: 3-phosphoshikimate 1-carboxyvinyltransferase [Bacteroidota bacterium]
MTVTISPSGLSGSIQAPTSKSSMQRACAAALLTKGKTTIINPGYSNDDKAALDIIQKLGAIVEILPDRVVVESTGVHPVSPVINCGESGLSIRMFTPIAALSDEAITITGEGSLPTRPMDFFDEIFPMVGIEIASNGGKLPLQIKGPLQPQNIEIDGSLSSQFLTGLLMAYSAAGASDVSIKVNNLKSKPYIDLTLKVMQDFGMHMPENRNHEEYYFGAPTTNDSQLKAKEYTVEGDWSGAAFLLVAGAVAGNITVKGLDVFSTQADKAILQAIMASGAIISVQPEQIEIGPAQLKPFHFDATDCPDLFPPLVALASFCNGKSVIQGVSRLAHKESNRGITLQEEFGKMGVEILLQDDLMVIDGGKGLKGAEVSSRHDHRIAMACAVAALKADGPTTINGAEAINKSYPDFYEHIKYLGGNIV